MILALSAVLSVGWWDNGRSGYAPACVGLADRRSEMHASTHTKSLLTFVALAPIDALGHMLVGEVARQTMDPKTVAAIDAVLATWK